MKAFTNLGAWKKLNVWLVMGAVMCVVGFIRLWPHFHAIPVPLEVHGEGLIVIGMLMAFKGSLDAMIP